MTKKQDLYKVKCLFIIVSPLLYMLLNEESVEKVITKTSNKVIDV